MIGGLRHCSSAKKKSRKRNAQSFHHAKSPDDPRVRSTDFRKHWFRRSCRKVLPQRSCRKGRAADDEFFQPILHRMQSSAGTDVRALGYLSKQASSEVSMRLPIAATILIAVGGPCLAQTSGGSSSGGAASGASGGAAARSGGAAPIGRATGSPAPSVPNISLPPMPRAPGVGNTPIDPQRNNVDVRPPTERLPGSTATEPGGSLKEGRPPSQPGNLTANLTANSDTANPPPSGGRPDPGGANSSPASRKDAAQAAVAECVGLWDKDTHMTRAQWRATCNRIQNRLDDVSSQAAGQPSGSRALE